MSEPKKKGDDPLAAALKAAEVKQLQEELERTRQEREAGELKYAELQADLDRWKDLAARAQADLQNAKARVEKDRGDMAAYAAEETMRRLLPTIDNLRRAVEHLPANLAGNEWAKGVVAIEQQLLKDASALGLERMQSLGGGIDAERHEALMTGPGKEGMITEVFEEGYLFRGKVLRTAKVRVGSGEETQRE